jgi:citrate synthase
LRLVQHLPSLTSVNLDALARHKGRCSLQTNLEINQALLLDAVRIDCDAFLQVFAISSIAHAAEQQKTG